MTAKTKAPEVRDVLEDGQPPSVGKVLESLRDAHAVERYERAGARLPLRERLAVVGRIEEGLAYDTLAEILDFPTAAAARSAVIVALLRLAAIMADLEQQEATSRRRALQDTLVPPTEPPATHVPSGRAPTVA